MTTATRAGGSAATSQSVPTTSTPSSGTTSLTCSPIPHLSGPRSASASSRPAQATRPPGSRKRLELELARAAASITRMIEAFQEQLITIDELRARMPALGPAKRTCAARPPPSMPSSPTTRPTSSSPTTWKASSPSSTATPRTRVSPNASACCGCWSKTSSSDPRRSPSGTASPSGNAPPAIKNPPTPTRRVTISQVAHCVGGVTAEPCGLPRSLGNQGAVRPLQRRLEPPPHIQQDPPLVSVVGYRLED